MKRLVPPLLRALLLRVGWAFALLVAAGGPWVLLQSVAWTGMLVRYAQSAPTLATALAETFDGEHPCDLCRTIQKGKAADSERAPQRAVLTQTAGKFVFFHQRIPWTLRLPRSMNARTPFVAPAGFGGIDATPPPVPPPRWG